MEDLGGEIIQNARLPQLGEENQNLSYEEYVLRLARLPEIAGRGEIASLDTPKPIGIPRLDRLSNIEALYMNLSLWLQCLTLGKKELYPSLVSSEESFLAYPYADLSLATMEYCRQVWMKVPAIQEKGLEKWETLWFGLELSACHKHLQLAGVIGELKESDRQLMVKIPQIRSSNSFIKKCKKILKKKDLAACSLFFYKEDDFDEGQIYIPFLGMGIITAIGESDKFLESHCLSFLNALGRFNLAMTDNMYQIKTALTGGVEYNSGNKKKSPGFGKKNPNGRPIGSFKSAKSRTTHEPM